MFKYKIGPKSRKGAGSFLKEASADDPIYKRGFAIGGMCSSPKPDSQEQESDSLPPFEIEARKCLEESLHRLYEHHTGQPWKEDDSQEQASDSLPPFEAEAHRSYEEAMWDMFEHDTGRKRPADAPKSPGQDEDE